MIVDILRTFGASNVVRVRGRATLSSVMVLPVNRRLRVLTNVPVVLRETIEFTNGVGRRLNVLMLTAVSIVINCVSKVLFYVFRGISKWCV